MTFFTLVDLSYLAYLRSQIDAAVKGEYVRAKEREKESRRERKIPLKGEELSPHARKKSRPLLTRAQLNSHPALPGTRRR